MIDYRIFRENSWKKRVNVRETEFLCKFLSYVMNDKLTQKENLFH